MSAGAFQRTDLNAPHGEHAMLKSSVRARLLAEPDGLPLGDRHALRSRLAEILADVAPLLPVRRVDPLLDELVREVDGFGPIEPLLADPEISEVMLNRPGSAFVERSGRLERVDLDLDAGEITRIAERIIAPLGLRLDRASPIVDARLPDGSRLHAVLPPLAIDGPCVTIRRFCRHRLDLHDFDVDGDARTLMNAAVRGGWNLLIAGATSAGKTTLLNTLADVIDPGERLVTIEETAELVLAQPHVIRLEARPPNSEGAGCVTVRDLVRAALRMRPDRIVVGEVRGGEALDMLQALNTGHDGSLCTVHANGADEALVRLETLALFSGVDLPVDAIRRQIGAAIDGVVFVTRDRDGRRCVHSLAEVPAGSCGTAIATRTILDRRGGELREVAAPSRPLRRAAAEWPEAAA